MGNYWWWSSALHLQRNVPQKTRWKRNDYIDYDTWTPVSLSSTNSRRPRSSASTTLSATPVINSSQPEKGKQKKLGK